LGVGRAKKGTPPFGGVRRGIVGNGKSRADKRRDSWGLGVLEKGKKR